MIRYERVAQLTKTSPIKSCAQTLLDRMADDLREAGFAGRGDIQSLLDRGWSRPVIAKLGPAAIKIARRTSTRQIARA